MFNFVPCLFAIKGSRAGVTFESDKYYFYSMLIMPFPFGNITSIYSNWTNLWSDDTSNTGMFVSYYQGNSTNGIEWNNRTSASYQFNKVSSVPNYSYFAMGELLV